jgi:hypothetical protein
MRTGRNFRRVVLSGDAGAGQELAGDPTGCVQLLQRVLDQSQVPDSFFKVPAYLGHGVVTLGGVLFLDAALPHHELPVEVFFGQQREARQMHREVP